MHTPRMSRDEETTQLCNYLLFSVSDEGSAHLEEPECDGPPSEDPARTLVLVNRQSPTQTVTVDMASEIDRCRLLHMVHAGVMD